MSYQVLARKWRPKSFESLIGQDHVVQALSNALEQQRLHHAYLFTGTRGVGKTTIARILAKSLNCELGITAKPCGVCTACTEIDKGRFIDMMEVDAASNTQVDAMRDLLDNAQYAPTVGRFKVYIIDEVHMLSKSAFNAMLKTLEEPPAHVKFILATTDPQKVPVTVLSRCLQFNLRQMNSGNITQHLQSILQQENIPFETPALNLIARAAAGSMRDALSLTDQAIAYGKQSVNETDVRDMLGAIDQSYLFDILHALIASDSPKLIGIAQQMDERSIDLEAALGDLAMLIHHVAVAQHSPSSIALDMPEREPLLALAQAISAETLQLYYQICILGRRDIALAPDELAGFSMTLLRMLAFKPDSTSQQGTQKPTGSAESRPVSASQALAQARPALQASAPIPERAPTTNTETLSVPVSVATPSFNPAPAISQPAISQSDISQPDSEETSPADSNVNFHGNWRHLVENELKLGLARALAQNCELIKFENDCFFVRIAENQKHLASANYKDKLISALNQHFGRKISIHIEMGQEVNTPAKQNAIEKAEMQSVAEQAIMQDAFVQALIQDMGATIVPNSIKPLQ